LWNKNECEVDTTIVTERRTGDTNGSTTSRGCKDEGDNDKRYEGSGHVIKKKMVETELAVFNVAKPHRKKLRANDRRVEKQDDYPVTQ